MSQSKLYVTSAMLAAAFLAGCVTKGTYEKLQAEKSQEVSALQDQRSALQDEMQSLRSQRSALEQQQADLRRQIEALERQKVQLLSTSQKTQSEYDSLVRDLKEELKKGELQVRQYKNMLTVEAAERLFFDSGRADLKDSGKAVLKSVGEALRGYEDKVIRVVGHTDNVPIKTRVFPSNWELSVARATTVVRYLQEVGIPPERMIAAGRGEHQPVAPNDDAGTGICVHQHDAPVTGPRSPIESLLTGPLG